MMDSNNYSPSISNSSISEVEATTSLSSTFTCSLCDNDVASCSSSPQDESFNYHATPTKYEIMKDEYRRHLRTRAKKLTELHPHNLFSNGYWSDKDIGLLLNEIEIEIGEKMNRFLYEDERRSYCSYLEESVPFQYPKSAVQIENIILWLWLTWEAISKATGQSWWNITEEKKHQLSLFPYDEDQRLKSKFKYFDACDKVFAYIDQDEGEDDEEYLRYYNDTIYF